MSFREVTNEELVYLKLKVDWHSLNVRVRLAFKGCALNVLIHDKSAEVRMAVAGQCYGLETLLIDDDSFVRKVAKIAHKDQTYHEAKSLVDDMFKQVGY